MTFAKRIVLLSLISLLPLTHADKSSAYPNFSEIEVPALSHPLWPYINGAIELGLPCAKGHLE